MHALRVALWAGGSLDNVGDRLIASVTETELARRLPAAQFRHYCPWAGADSAGVDPLWIDEAGRWPGAGATDAVVVAGGGVFSGPPFRHPIMQVFCLGNDPAVFDPEVRVAWHAVGLQDGTAGTLTGAGADYLRRLADRLDLLTVRSAAAADRLAAAGVPAPTVVPDPSFALPPMRRALRVAPSRPRVGVAVGSAQTSPRLVHRLAGPELATRCRFVPELCQTPGEVLAEATGAQLQRRQRGFDDTVVSAVDELTRWADVELVAATNIYADDLMAHRLHDRTGAPVQRLDRLDAATLTATLAGYDVVVVSRFHSAILAARAGTPVILLDPFGGGAGTTKAAELATALGIPDRYWTYGRPTPALPELVAAALTAGAVEHEHYRATHTRAGESFDQLTDILAAATRPAGAGTTARARA